MVTFDLLDALGTLKLNQRLALTPGKGRAVFNGVLLVGFSLFKRFRVLFPETHPFDLLLQEAECAAAARSP